MMIDKTSWLEDFGETTQDILEDALLLDALSAYLSSGREFTRGERADYLPQAFQRLRSHLSQENICQGDFHPKDESPPTNPDLLP